MAGPVAPLPVRRRQCRDALTSGGAPLDHRPAHLRLLFGSAASRAATRFPNSRAIPARESTSNPFSPTAGRRGSQPRLRLMEAQDGISSVLDSVGSPRWPRFDPLTPSASSSGRRASHRASLRGRVARRLPRRRRRDADPVANSSPGATTSRARRRPRRRRPAPGRRPRGGRPAGPSRCRCRQDRTSGAAGPSPSARWLPEPHEQSDSSSAASPCRFVSLARAPHGAPRRVITAAELRTESPAIRGCEQDSSPRGSSGAAAVPPCPEAFPTRTPTTAAARSASSVP